MAPKQVVSEEKLMSDIDFKFENFEEYFGGAEQVKKTMNAGRNLKRMRMSSFTPQPQRSFLI